MSDLAEQPADEQRGVPWKWLLMLAATAVILYLLVSQLAGADNLLEVVQRADWRWVGYAVGFVALNFLLVTLHWRLILRAMGFEVPTGRAIRVILATRPFDLLAPSRANDLLRPLGVRDIVPVLEGSGSVLAQRVIDVQSLCLLGLSGALFSGLWKWAGLLGLALLGGWTVIALLFWKRALLLRLPLVGRFEKKLGQLAVAFVALKERPAAYALTSLVSLCAWGSALGIVWSLGHAFGAGLGPLEIGALWPIAIFVGMLPLTVAGMGTRDAAFISLLEATRQAPVAQAPVLATTLGYALAASCLTAVIGIPFMLRYMYDLPDATTEHEDRRDEQH